MAVTVNTILFELTRGRGLTAQSAVVAKGVKERELLRGEEKGIYPTTSGFVLLQEARGTSCIFTLFVNSASIIISSSYI